MCLSRDVSELIFYQGSFQSPGEVLGLVPGASRTVSGFSQESSEDEGWRRLLLTQLCEMGINHQKQKAVFFWKSVTFTMKVMKELASFPFRWLQYGQTLKSKTVLNFVLSVVVQYSAIKGGAGTVLFKYLLLEIPLPFSTHKYDPYLLIFCVWKGPLSILLGCPIFHCVMGCILKMNSPKQLQYIAITFLFFWRTFSLGICTLISLQVGTI